MKQRLLSARQELFMPLACCPGNAELFFYIQKHSQQQDNTSPSTGPGNHSRIGHSPGECKASPLPLHSQRRLNAASWLMGKRMCLLQAQFSERKGRGWRKVCSSYPEKSGISTIPVPCFLLASSRQLPAGLKDILISTQDILTHI